MLTLIFWHIGSRRLHGTDRHGYRSLDFERARYVASLTRIKIYGSTFAWAVHKFRDKFITDDVVAKGLPSTFIGNDIRPSSSCEIAWRPRHHAITVTRIFVKSLMTLSFRFNVELDSLKGDTLAFLILTNLEKRVSITPRHIYIYPVHSCHGSSSAREYSGYF